METTDKQSCIILAELLAAHGIEDVVLSPGSRNAPLIIAAARNARLRCHTVVDERSAAFFGLGIAVQTGRPVALICTSGSAVLNYGPAVAEAFYRHVPLIAISADRPLEWIDQDDSQTIRQYEVLGNIVKGSYEIGVECDTPIQKAYVSRTVNDALICAKRQPCGPVHINVRLDEPLGKLMEYEVCSTSKIELAQLRRPTLSCDTYQDLSKRLVGKKIMIIAGFASPDEELDTALNNFASKADCAILYEAQSNLHIEEGVPNIDATLTTLDAEERKAMRPDIVITCGGSIVSRMIKRYLRDCDNLEHWHISYNANSIDCFTSLTERIECEAADFFDCLSDRLQKQGHSFKEIWLKKSVEANRRTIEYYKNCPWSDFYAIGRLIDLVPEDWQLHLSNGTSVRYVQLFDYSRFPRIEANRGVSGIDGSTSTAIGAHIHYNDVTMLLTGDMSTQYDIGALALNEISPRFKMVVLNNSGGGIFRFIKSTSKFEECERYFAGCVNLPVSKLADAYGFGYFEISDRQSFDEIFLKFSEEKERPALLNIVTPPIESAELLKLYFNDKS